MTAADGLLVSVESLAAELAARGTQAAKGAEGARGSEAAGPRGPGPVVLDVRWRLGGPPGVDSYRAGHLPGAVFIDLDRDLAGPPGAAGRHPLPGTAVFQAAMRAAGVNTGRQVVVYDDGDSTIAARGWWTLRYYGHENVRVLDGGYRAWIRAGLAVTTAEPAPVTGDFTARPGHMPVLDAAGAQATARTGLLFDARAGERYRGETETVDPVAGHIPGAVSAPTAGNVNADGTFKDAAELAARFASLGAADAADAAGAAEGTGTIGAYCGSGVTAAHEVLALTLAGLPAALYVGSWSNWVADPARPVATGE
jgi:thiosulfate/3-mercaptopyruvate sulfurtransferase